MNVTVSDAVIAEIKSRTNYWNEVWSRDNNVKEILSAEVVDTLRSIGPFIILAGIQLAVVKQEEKNGTRKTYIFPDEKTRFAIARLEGWAETEDMIARKKPDSEAEKNINKRNNYLFLVGVLKGEIEVPPWGKQIVNGLVGVTNTPEGGDTDGKKMARE